MTLGLDKGTNAQGHMGWISVRCRICGRHLSLTGNYPGTRQFIVVYACPKCARDYEAYFCHADARKVKYTCPYCGGPLKPLTPIPAER